MEHLVFIVLCLGMNFTWTNTNCWNRAENRVSQYGHGMIVAKSTHLCNTGSRTFFDFAAIIACLCVESWMRRFEPEPCQKHFGYYSSQHIQVNCKWKCSPTRKGNAKFSEPVSDGSENVVFILLVYLIIAIQGGNVCKLGHLTTVLNSQFWVVFNAANSS